MSYAALAASSAALNVEYLEDDLTPENLAWVGSPFNWIREQSSGTKGAIGRDLASSIIGAISAPVTRDRLALEVAGKRIRVKFSMAWNLDSFRFQQIRDEEFDFVLCLGLYPDAAFGWFIPKEEFYVDGVWQERDGVTGQHGGVLATNTRWFEVDPANVTDWLATYGGTLAAVEGIIAAQL